MLTKNERKKLEELINDALDKALRAKEISACLGVDRAHDFLDARSKLFQFIHDEL